VPLQAAAARKSDSTSTSVDSVAPDAEGWVQITPDLAARLLARNTRNRHQSPSQVAFYARQISEGRWQRNPQPILVDSDGHLLDGQHRLAAVIEADTPIWAKVEHGVSPDLMQVVDTGKSRTMGDLLVMAGACYGSAANTYAAILRRCIAWEKYTNPFSGMQGGASGTWGARPSNAEGLDAMKRYPADEIERAVKRAHLIHRAEIRGGDAVWGTLLLRFARLDEEATIDFVQSLVSGAELPANSPILALRNRLQHYRGPRNAIPVEEIASMIIRAWNAYRRRTPLTRVVARRPNDPFPIPE
jgi:hypothetical protein